MPTWPFALLSRSLAEAVQSASQGGDSHLDRPIERTGRDASVCSQIGASIVSPPSGESAQIALGSNGRINPSPASAEDLSGISPLPDVYQKGLYWEILVKMAAHFGRSHDLVLLQTRPPGETALWRPPHTINITGNLDVPTSTYAKVIVDTAVSLTGGRGSNPFFPTKAQLAIQTAFEILRHLEAYPTIPNVHILLLSPDDANATIEELMNRGDQRSLELVTAFRSYLDQPEEQLGGVQGTLSTYLEFFLSPEISEVFCANVPTFSVSEIDDGKIVCLAMPQKFQSERLYINTILKLSYYFHALSRFDKSAEEREQDNLIILFADEGQEIITGAESAFADHRAVGVIREARATIVLATQAYTSIHGSLDKRYADVLLLNLSNELIFTVANHDSAVIASKNIGEREVVEKSWGLAAGKRSYNYQRKIKPFFEAYQLRKLPKFNAVIRHCEKPFRKRLVPPINLWATKPAVRDGSARFSRRTRGVFSFSMKSKKRIV